MGYDLFHGYAIYPLLSHHSKRSFIVRSIAENPRLSNPDVFLRRFD